MWILNNQDLPVHKVAKALLDQGAQVYLVGGAVRDICYGLYPKDYDLATNFTPDKVSEVLTASSFKVVPSGIQYGTVTAVTDEENIEITTFRGEGTYSDGRRPDSVTFADTIEEDLSRRDFTINAMAIDMKTHQLIDLYGGLSDLVNHVIRCVGNPSDRFREDSLRMLRAVRFATALNCEIYPCLEAIKTNSKLIHNVSMERIFSELVKIFGSRYCDRGLVILKDSLLLEEIIPEIKAMYNYDQKSKYHMYDLWTHTLRTVQCASATPKLIFACLLHDIGKPRCAVTNGDTNHYYGHEKVSSEMAAEILTRLKAPREFIDDVSELILHHTYVNFLNGPLSDRDIRKLLSKFGYTAAGSLMVLINADNRAYGTCKDTSGNYINAIYKMADIYNSKLPLTPKDLAINGHDILKIVDREPGPWVGNFIKDMLYRIIDDPSKNTREYLEGEIHKLAQRMNACKIELYWS